MKRLYSWGLALLPMALLAQTTYYTEDFDNGLNGWTVTNPAGNVPWTITSDGPAYTSSTFPVPALNTSTPGGWAMVDDDFVGTSGSSSETRLISPPIDLSAATGAITLEFIQYIQEWQDEHTYVGVSTDGGATWNEVEINEGVGRNGRPNPEVINLDITAWVAGDPGNVQLRFRYTASWDYGWQLDNVTIKDRPSEELALMWARRTNFAFDVTDFSSIDYSIYPTTQVRNIQPHGLLGNIGTDQVPGAQFDVTVTGPGGAVYNGSSSSVNLSAGTGEQLFVAGFNLPPVPGTYTFDMSAATTGNDADPTNNSASSTIEVSNDIWAIDHGTVDGGMTRGSSTGTQRFEVGNFFEAVNDDVMIGIDVAIHEDTDLGVLVYGMVRDLNDDPLLLGEPEHEVTAADLNPIGGSNFITLLFDDPLPVIAGEVYAVMVAYFGGNENMVIGTSGRTFPGTSQVLYPNSPNTTNFQFYTHIPMVRARMIGDVSVQEHGQDAFKVSLWPNPATDLAQLAFEAPVSGRATLLIRDAAGREVLTRDLGNIQAGTQQFAIPVQALANGMYAYDLRVDELRVTGRLAVQR